MLGEFELTASPLEQVRDFLHSAERDRETGASGSSRRHVLYTADLRARVHEMGQDALASGDAALALKALKLQAALEEMDREAEA
jgi:hypothetical protein